MKLLILCAVLSVVLAVSLASPARTQIHDVSDSSSSSEEKLDEEVNVKNNVISDNEEDNTSNSSEEKSKKKFLIVELEDDEVLDIKKLSDRSRRSYDIDNNLQSHNYIKVKDEGSIKYDKYLKLKRLRRDLQMSEDLSPRFARSADTSEENSSEEHKKHKEPHAHHHEAGHEHSEAPSGKPDTAPAETLHLAAKPDTAPAESDPKPEEEPVARRRRALKLAEELSPRFARSADTSEEHSSEEHKKDKEPHAHHHEAGHEHSEAPAGKLDTAPAESDPKPEEEHAARRRRALQMAEELSPRFARSADTSEEHSSEEHKKDKQPHAHHHEAGHEHSAAARRRRSLEVSSEETHSEQEQDANEVFIFSNEKQEASEENFKNIQFKTNEYVVLSDNDVEQLDKLPEKKKTSDEDYAQGCGGSTGNHDEDSNENSNEDNETTYNNSQ